MAMLKCCSVLPFLVVACLVSQASAGRELSLFSPEQDVGGPTAMEVGELEECWEALSEIKACSNEITAFLINGSTDIEAPCCVAIMKITHSCWPALLTTLGFSADQADLLRGYCDAANVPSPIPSLPLIS